MRMVPESPFDTGIQAAHYVAMSRARSVLSLIHRKSS